MKGINLYFIILEYYYLEIFNNLVNIGNDYLIVNIEIEHILSE
jgi:hypothetical protein